MVTELNIEKILKYNILGPALIVDSLGRVMEFNDHIARIFPEMRTGSIFFDYFEEEAGDLIEKLVLESKTYDKIVEEELSFGLPKVKGRIYYFVITPLQKDSGFEFLISIQIREQKEFQKTPDRFFIHTGDIIKIIDNKKIIDVIEQIKKDFPFTFIAKKKIRKDIDELKEGIWVKDINRNFLLVNRKFADVLKSQVAKLEGSNEEESIPKSINELFIAFEEYIKETGRVIITDIPGFSDNSGTIYSIIQFPLFDLDNNVVAFVGVINPAELDQFDLKKHYHYYHEAVYSFSEAMFVIDKNDRIVSCSKKAVEIFDKDNSNKILKENIGKIFGEPLYKKISSFLNSGDDLTEQQFSFEFDNELGLVDVLIHKIRKTGDDHSGYYIVLSQKDETQTQTEMKAKMYDIIMHTSPEAIFVYEIDNLKFLDVNESALQLYGYSRDEFLQMDLTDLYAPEDIQTLIESSARKTITSSFTGPWRHKRSDNTSILVELSKITLDYKGKRAHLNIVRDITEKIDLDKKMQLFRASFEKTNDLIIITDVDGFIIFTNNRACNVLGYSDVELDKKSFISVVADEDRALVNSTIFNSDSVKSVSMEIKLKRITNEEIKVRLNSTPILDYNQKIDSYNLTINVMDDSREIIKTVVQTEVTSLAQQPLDAEFLSNLFHEILTPINVIVGFVQELTESISQPNDEQKEAAQIITENQKLLLQIMDTAVEYSHIELGKVQLEAEKLVFVELIDEIQNNIKKIAEVKNQELTYGKISSSLSFISDKSKFISLVSLLLRFAFKISDQKKLYLSAYSRTNDEFMISIKDNRAAISAKLTNELKDVFSLDESKVKQSTGISRFTIRLTRKLAELLKAKVEVIEKGGEPIEFALLFPLALEAKLKQTESIKSVTEKTIESNEKEAAAIKEIPVKQEPPLKKVSKKVTNETVTETVTQLRKEIKTPEVPASRDLSLMRCLYIEDQVDSQILFKMQMKSIKIIDFAMTLENALPLLKKNRYDFIAIDINLPGEYNGLDALRIIRTLPGYKSTPVIAVSAYVLPGDKQKFIQAGFNEFVAKPLMQNKIIEALARIL